MHEKTSTQGSREAGAWALLLPENSLPFSPQQAPLLLGGTRYFFLCFCQC